MPNENDDNWVYTETAWQSFTQGNHEYEREYAQNTVVGNGGKIVSTGSCYYTGRTRSKGENKYNH